MVWLAQQTQAAAAAVQHLQQVRQAVQVAAA
jgi:hypothetical protein